MAPKRPTKIGGLGAGLDSLGGTGAGNLGEKLELIMEADASGFVGAFGEAFDGASKLGEKIFFLTEGVSKVMELVGRAAELAKFSAELKNMADRVPTRQLEAMRKATEGAVDKITLMKFSMKALSGELRLTERGMDTVLRAANTLADQGFGDTMENAERLTEALRKGSSKALKEYGIALTDTANRGKNTNAMMEKFIALANTEVNVNAQLKAVERLHTAWADFVTDIKAKFGELVLTGAEAALKLAAKPTQISEAFGKARLSGAIHGRAERLYKEQYGTEFGLEGKTDRLQDFLRGRMGKVREQAHIQLLNEFMQGQAADAGFLLADVKAKTAGGYFAGKPPPKEPGGAAGPTSGGVLDVLSRASQNRGLTDAIPEYARGAWSTLQGWGNNPLPAASSLFGERDDGGISGRLTVGGGEKKSRLDEFNDTTGALSSGYDALRGGIAAAVEAAVTGSDNIGKAFLKASSAALKALAVESATRALYEGALALGSLAFGDMAGAALHGKSAAMFGLAAAAAGLGSAGLAGLAGGGGSAPTASSSPGGGVASNASGERSSGDTFIIQIGDGYVGKPDELAAKINSSIRGARRSGRVREGGSMTFKV